tara:strand:+ start:1411 stop:1635 length:225 start_codon:yes stop_codon:yes gene_type:complete
MSTKTINEIEENKFIYLSNLENLLNLYDDLEFNYKYNGLFSTSSHKDFIDIILKNIVFIPNQEENNSDSNNEDN